MIITDQAIAGFVQQYFLPFARIGMMFMVMPVVGSRIVSPRVRLALAGLLTVAIVPILPEFPSPPPLSLPALLMIFREVAIGAIIGFTFQIIFQMFVLSGQYIAMKMGLGFAMMNDPTNGVQTTVISQFFLILTTVMFVVVNGHLYLISLLVESFQTLPIGSYKFNFDKFIALVNLGEWMFATALVFALPVMTSLLFVNIAFGIMSRAAPQLNIFAVGFPFTLVCGLGLLWVGLANYFESFSNSMNFGFEFVHELIESR